MTSSTNSISTSSFSSFSSSNRDNSSLSPISPIQEKKVSPIVVYAGNPPQQRLFTVGQKINYSPSAVTTPQPLLQRALSDPESSNFLQTLLNQERAPLARSASLNSERVTLVRNTNSNNMYSSLAKQLKGEVDVLDKDPTYDDDL